MSGTSIRVSHAAKERLEQLKREGESFDEVILRLTESDKWAGFGILADADRDTRDGLERIRRGTRERIDDDLEEMGDTERGIGDREDE